MLLLWIIIIIVLMIAVNSVIAISVIKFNLSSASLYIAGLFDAILIVLLLSFLNIGNFIVAYTPYGGEYNWTDIGLEVVEFGAFIGIFAIAFVARWKYPVIGGKGWNILLFAVILGSIGMFLDIFGEFVNFAQDFFPMYKLITGLFQIAGIIGLVIAFLLFYKFSEILFHPSRE